MEELKRKVLVALDGSDQSLETVRYLGRLPAKKGIEIVLFSVFSSIPEVYWDFQQDPKVGARVAEIKAWQSQKEKELSEFMEKAAAVLKKARLHEKAIKIKIRQRKEGVTRDILKEARKHYSAVLVGRKGAGAVKNVLWGSVTAKLMEKLYFCPLIVVSKGRKPAKVLIAMDQSEGAMRAVEFAGTVLGGSGVDVALVHVIRLKDKQEIAKAEIAVNKALDDAAERLSKAGIPQGRITKKIITGAESRSGSIVDEARKGDYGTIVLGRRGLSKVKQFSIGRVAHRVAQLATGSSVWIVN